MIDHSVRLAFAMTTQVAAFTVSFVLTGSLPYALALMAGGEEARQDDQTALENLFWD